MIPIETCRTSSEREQNPRCNFANSLHLTSRYYDNQLHQRFLIDSGEEEKNIREEMSCPQKADGSSSSLRQFQRYKLQTNQGTHQEEASERPVLCATSVRCCIAFRVLPGKRGKEFPIQNDGLVIKTESTLLHCDTMFISTHAALFRFQRFAQLQLLVLIVVFYNRRNSSGTEHAIARVLSSVSTQQLDCKSSFLRFKMWALVQQGQNLHDLSLWLGESLISSDGFSIQTCELVRDPKIILSIHITSIKMHMFMKKMLGRTFIVTHQTTLDRSPFIESFACGIMCPGWAPCVFLGVFSICTVTCGDSSNQFLPLTSHLL